MTLFLIPTTILTILSLIVLLFTVYFVSPVQNGSLIPINLAYFFISAFLSLVGTVTLVLYWFGNLRLKKTRITDLGSIHKPRLIFLRSLRHGILIAAAFVGFGLLKTLDFANPLNVILLVSALVLVEIYFFGH